MTNQNLKKSDGDLTTPMKSRQWLEMTLTISGARTIATGDQLGAVEKTASQGQNTKKC